MSVSTQWQRFTQAMLKPIDASALATFRIIYGALMVWEVIRYIQYNRIYFYYVEPTFFFPYEFFQFVKPWPAPFMYLHFYIMGLFAVGIMLGFFFRISVIGFLLTYSYVFLIDKTQHNNHYYLICLLTFLLSLTHAHRWMSVDKKFLSGLAQDTIPYWQQSILCIQMVIVYFYAGIAKLNIDWLRGEPIGTWISNRADYPIGTAIDYFGDGTLAMEIAGYISRFFLSPEAGYFFAYSGLIFDLLIGFALLWPRTRLVALIPLIFFHLTNKYLFNIGIFPYLALASTILFAPPDWPRRLLRQTTLTLPTAPIVATRWHQVTVGFVTLYLILQIIVPLRHWLYPGNVAWNEEGHRFSWRMKLRSKAAELFFTVTDPNTNQTWAYDMSAELTDRQIRKMSTRPDMIYQYAQHIKQTVEKDGIQNPIIRAESWAALNGRPYQRFIDPTVNLAEVENYDNLFAHADWIVPFKAEVPFK